MLIAFHKPHGVLSQFTGEHPGARTLAEFGFPKEVYPLGRLDADSEGLLLLSDEGELNYKLLNPQHGHRRTYWAQVEKVPGKESLRCLEKGVIVQGKKCRPCRAWILEPQPEVAPRVPPIRHRKAAPVCWIGLELTEGRNRQVRRMTAAVGHPTLRLIRVKIGGVKLNGLAAGDWKVLSEEEREKVFGS